MTVHGMGGAHAAPSGIFDYARWPSAKPGQWSVDPDVSDEAARGGSTWDKIDFHVDLGCGRLRKGRIGVDRYPSEAADVIADLDHGVWTMAWRLNPSDEQYHSSPGQLAHPVHRSPCSPLVVPSFSASVIEGDRPPILGLPFADSSIRSIISHHAFEHVWDLIPLMGECYRVLERDGILRIITPLFPSRSAVEDPDHKRYIMEGTFDSFCGTPGDDPQSCWLGSFSVPYTSARFQMEDKLLVRDHPNNPTWEQANEIRVALRAMK